MCVCDMIRRGQGRNLRALVLGALIAVAGMFVVPADAQSFRAGVTRLTVQDATPFDAFVVYPSQAAEVSLTEGLTTLSASRPGGRRA